MAGPGADRLREALGYETIALPGHSCGGYLALEYALRHGDRLEGLVLCATAPAMDYPGVVIDDLSRRGTECLPDFDVGRRLGEIDLPTLVLAGRHDWITPPERGATRLHRGIPDSELHVFEESGHSPFIEEPEAFVRLVGEWLGETLHAN